MAKSRNVYSLPIAMEFVRPMLDNVLHLNTHVGSLRHAIDYVCDEGTPILAAGTGVVVWVRDDSNVGGTDWKKFWDLGNRVVVRHGNGEYSAYEHLRYNGAAVVEGDRVEEGSSIIGYSGNTGLSSTPHLHFEVFNEPDEEECEGETLEVRFRD